VLGTHKGTVRTLWGAPFVTVCGVFVPIQLVLPILLLRSDSQVSAAAILLIGLSSVRLLQCLLLGLVLSSGPSAGLILMLGMVCLAAAAISRLPSWKPNRRAGTWLAAADFVTVIRGLIVGLFSAAAGAKRQLITLAAIASTQDPDFKLASGVIAFLAIAALALAFRRLVDGYGTR
jgi:hypothetical protein